MSVESLSIALHHSRSAGTTRLVLVGIANHDGDGGAWPAVATLARYAGVTVRSVQLAIRELERLREVQRVVQGGGDRFTAEHARPNLYRFLLECPPDCDRSKHHRVRGSAAPLEPLDGLNDPPPTVDLSTGVKPASPGQLSTGVKPASPGGVKPASPEPSYEPRDRKRPRATTDRAREAVNNGWTWDHACVDGSSFHQVSATTGACAFCAARRIRIPEVNE